MRRWLDADALTGKRYLDVGSGSGLFSLAARRLGAIVYSFDFDADSVACTRELRRRFFADDAHWTVEPGSILDREFLARLGSFDIVYSWGVLHHTGDLWQAVENTLGLVAPDGAVMLAIYNDQGPRTARWRRLKQFYNWLPPKLRWLALAPGFARLWGPTILRDTLRGRPLRSWKNYGSERGMSAWRDVVDWVGGWPFEVATPEQVFDFCRSRGFTLTALKTCGGGHGCNEFAFRKQML